MAVRACVCACACVQRFACESACVRVRVRARERGGHSKWKGRLKGWWFEKKTQCQQNPTDSSSNFKWPLAASVSSHRYRLECKLSYKYSQGPLHLISLLSHFYRKRWQPSLSYNNSFPYHLENIMIKYTKRNWCWNIVRSEFVGKLDSSWQRYRQLLQHRIAFQLKCKHIHRSPTWAKDVLL